MASRGSILKVSSQKYLLEPFKLVIIPITTRKVFIYHKHREETLNKDSTVIRIESWLIRKSESLLNKMVKSPKPMYKKIINTVDYFLDKTPWTESSLRSLPGENRLIKGKEQLEHLTIKQDSGFDDAQEIKPFHACYYPSGIISPDQLSSSLKFICSRGLSYHWKYTLYCLFGLPFTFPLIIVPIIPNVPGFYLTYRAYCNYKAYMGAHHLQILLKQKSLQPRDVQGYSEMFEGKQKFGSENEETLIMDTNLMARVLDLLEIHEIEPDLRKAIRQEKKRLQQH